MRDDQTLRALPRNTVNLIGSTQVITSVYSVVKELVENSLDADASSIDIKLENYGLDRIEVIDNGCGVKAADVPYMAKRHFTSKITCSEDLSSLITYGFRGEALGSLCAVSKVAITTKTAADPVSHVYTIGPDGDIVDKKPSHTGKGTIVSSRNLFHNVPVRKQFYSAGQRKKDDVKRVEHLLMAYAIQKPALRITLKHGKDLLFQKTALKDVKSAVHSVFGRLVANQMLYREKYVEELQLKVNAYLPKPGSDVKDMSMVLAEKTFVTVNNRPVSIPEINKILRNYYSTCHDLDNYRHPVCFISLDIPPNLVDVNLDPNKTKVLFQEKSGIQVALEEVLVEVYGVLDNVPSWHYAEADGKAENNNNKRTDEDVMKTKRPMRPTITYSRWPGQEDTMEDEKPDGHKTQPDKQDVSVEKEATVDKVTEFPPFSLTFHTKSSNQTESDGAETTLENSERCESVIESHKDFLEEGDSCTAIGKLGEDRAGFQISLGDEESESTETNLAKEITMEEGSIEEVSNNIDQGSSSEKDDSSHVEGEVPVRDVIIVNGDKEDETEMETDLPILDEATLNCVLQGELRPTNNDDGDLNIDPDAWSRGHISALSTLVEPVKLLPPSSLHMPGKRPLSPSPKGSESSGQPKNKGLKLTVPSNQTTLLDMINSQQVKKPVSPFSHFYEEKFPSLSQEFLDESDYAIEKRVREEWDKMNNDDRVSFREKCWIDTKRYEKMTKAIKNENNKSGGDLEIKLKKKTTGGPEKVKRVLKKRLYGKESTLKIPMDCIRNPNKDVTDSDETDDLKVIGPTHKCDDVWVCAFNNKLYLVNVWRLSEVALYRKLKADYKLPFKAIDPVTLDSRTLKEKASEALEKLAKESQGNGTFFHITDERIVSNGFDIRCHCDSSGNVTSELVGFCSVIPTYDLKDLNRVLETLHSNFDVGLGETRPLKASYFLQGEAVRMARQNTAKKTQTDVYTLVKNATGNVEQPCLHHKPIFKELINFSNFQSDEIP